MNNKEKIPKVSVLMPCYNHEKYVARSIECILNQTYPNIELIVLDNGSTADKLHRYSILMKMILQNVVLYFKKKLQGTT